MKLIIAGCGALGSWIGLMLSHRSFETIWLVDDERIGAENIATSAYNSRQVGKMKVNTLAGMMFLNNPENRNIQTVNKTVRSTDLWVADLIVDTFDNAEARSSMMHPSTLHVGVSVARSADIMWNEKFDLYKDTHPRGGNPICTHHLGASIIQRASALAVFSIELYLNHGIRKNYHITPSGKLLEV